ncbi:DNA-3-methyladenine glycosylase family protein [Streptomyces sp. NBC_01497]|uniref:DNA-3-methyladenine glycosylase family protein n=1 Tax=Streptomyces sp. NBC_01497 TaxID=2903885 RepID=UPI002E33B8FF|nr:hypothetical protein [Streptomyces sp. NBC_01497]
MTRERVRAPEEALRLADPVLATIIDEVDGMGGIRPALPPDPGPPNDPSMPTDCFGAIIRGIAGQNISAFASRAIYRKLTDRFGGRPPTPRQILDDDPDELRVAAGLSNAKTISLRSLAEHILSGELQLDQLHKLPDEDVIEQLSAVKGIGAWTAERFLIRHLNRPDILPVGDLGIRNGVRKIYELPSAPAHAELRRIAEPWRPYRTRHASTCGAWRKRNTDPARARCVRAAGSDEPSGPGPRDSVRHPDATRSDARRRPKHGGPPPPGPHRHGGSFRDLSGASGPAATGEAAV